MIMIALSLQACASQKLRSKRVGDIYKTEKISSRTDTSYKISAITPTQITVTVQTDTYETYRRYYEKIEDITTKKASWTGKTYLVGTIAGAVTFGTALLAGQDHTKQIVEKCSYDGQIIDGNVCSIKTESRKTGSYIKKDEEMLADRKDAVITIGNVMVSINGRPVEDISIKPDGTAEVDLFKFPELARTKKDLNIEYRYRDAVLSTTLESAVNYVAKRIISEINSRDWKEVAIGELNTEGMPSGFGESLITELSQDKKVSVKEKEVIGLALARLKINFADLLNPITSTDIRKRFGKLTGADGIIGGKVTKNIQTAGMKKWPDIFDTEGIQIDLKFVDIEKEKISKQNVENTANDPKATIKSNPRQKIELSAGARWNGFFRSAEGARYIYLDGRPVDVCAIPFVSYMLWPSPSGRYAVGYCAETPNKPHFYDTRSKKHIQPSNWQECDPSHPFAKAAWTSDDTFISGNCKIDLSASLR